MILIYVMKYIKDLFYKFFTKINLSESDWKIYKQAENKTILVERNNLTTLQKRNMSKVIKKLVLSTSRAPRAIGPYSQAIQVDKTIYVSGQLGMRADTMKLVDGGVRKETRQALFNLGEVLKVAGCTYDHVVKTTVLLEDMQDFEMMNMVYEEFFKGQKPARSAYQVGGLPRGAKVEIEAIAMVEK